MRDVFIFGDNETVKAIINVGEEAVVEGRDLFKGDWSEEAVRSWFEMNPLASVNIADQVLGEYRDEFKKRGIAVQLDDDEDFRYDDQLFQNLNGMAFSYGCGKENEDFLCQLHKDVFTKGLEPALEKFFAEKK